MSKEDFIINEVDKGYTVAKKQIVFWFFEVWVEMTFADTELAPEELLIFKSKPEAEEFINKMTN